MKKEQAKIFEPKIYREPRMLLPLEETARRLGISPQTIRNSISKRTNRTFPLKPKKWGKRVMFDSLDVEAYINSLPYSD